MSVAEIEINHVVLKRFSCVSRALEDEVCDHLCNVSIELSLECADFDRSCAVHWTKTALRF